MLFLRHISAQRFLWGVWPCGDTQDCDTFAQTPVWARVSVSVMAVETQQATCKYRLSVPRTCRLFISDFGKAGLQPYGA